MRTRKWRFIAFVSFIIMYAFTASAQYKITDSVYYNYQWKICEKPIAAYYRIGILAGTSDGWYYTGKIKDYTINGTLLMTGEYNVQGVKEGKFQFYYTNGNILAEGEYKQGLMSGPWNWYYANGNEKAIIVFAGNDRDFYFQKFTDSTGKTTLANGSGDFLWCTNPFEEHQSTYIFNGSFTEGKRSGNWSYHKPPGADNTLMGFTEKYNRKGECTGVITEDYKYKNIKAFQLQFFPVSLHATEKMLYDDLFYLNGRTDSIASNALIYYLLEHKPTEVNLRYKIFDSAFAIILRTLDRYRNQIYFTQKRNIDSKIEFMIGSKGYLENITFTGTGLDSNEQRFFPFMLSKFKYIEMPGDQKVGVETNYTIYCYSIDLEEIMPANNNVYRTKELVFSFIPRAKMEKFVHENKDELKKLNKQRMNYYYYRRN